MTMAGYDFNMPYGTYGSGYYNLEGKLEDSQLIDTTVHITGSAQFILIPEPITFLMLAIGGLTIRKR
jgi:hypothetical protein